MSACRKVSGMDMAALSLQNFIIIPLRLFDTAALTEKGNMTTNSIPQLGACH